VVQLFDLEDPREQVFCASNHRRLRRIPGASATFTGPAEGHDSAVLSAGFSIQWTPTLTTYLNYDGQLGRQNYDSNGITGGVRISF